MQKRVLGIVVLWAVSLHVAHASGVTELAGTGVQIYRCAPQPPGFGWTLQAPDAQLQDSAGKAAGHHFAGPSWQAEDGSTITGKPIANGIAPGAASIPWLVVQVTGHTGAGRFAGVTYVVRSHTSGGLAPASGCDQAHAGAGVRVPYTATYTFFGTGDQTPLR